MHLGAHGKTRNLKPSAFDQARVQYIGHKYDLITQSLEFLRHLGIGSLGTGAQGSILGWEEGLYLAPYVTNLFQRTLTVVGCQVPLAIHLIYS